MLARRLLLFVSRQRCLRNERWISSTTTTTGPPKTSSGSSTAPTAVATIAIAIGLFSWHRCTPTTNISCREQTTQCEEQNKKFKRNSISVGEALVEQVRRDKQEVTNDVGTYTNEKLHNNNTSEHHPNTVAKKPSLRQTKSMGAGILPKDDNDNERKDNDERPKQHKENVSTISTDNNNNGIYDNREDNLGILPEYRKKGFIPRRIQRLDSSATTTITDHNDNHNSDQQNGNRSTTSNFFAKEMWVLDTIPIRAHKSVSDSALYIAADRVSRMLRHLPPQVTSRLRRRGAAFHIIGTRQHTSDLPEHSHLKGVMGGYTGEEMTLDERTRGMGGVHSSCGEENLIDLDTDPRYKHKDILCHEFAHCIMDVGLPEALRKEIEAVYELSVHHKKRWQRTSNNSSRKTSEKEYAYAATNAQEYWAELSMWFLNSHGEFVDHENRKPPPGPGGLALYDPDGFELLNQIYTGAHPLLKETDSTLPHLVPLDSSSSTSSSSISENDDETAISERKSVPVSKSNASNHVTVEFDNRGCNCDWKLFWITDQGDRKQYGIVPQHSSLSQRTYTGHVWLLEPTDNVNHNKSKNSRRIRSGTAIVYSAADQSSQARISVDSGCSSNGGSNPAEA